MEKKERNTRLVDRRQRLVESVANTARNQKQVKRADKMKISKERLRQIIKEEVSKAIQADRIMKPDVWKTLDAQQWIVERPKSSRHQVS